MCDSDTPSIASPLQTWGQGQSETVKSETVSETQGSGSTRTRSRGIRRAKPPPGASDWLSKMIDDVPASLPPRRLLNSTPPPDPTTLRELYDSHFEVIRSPKWREQLIERPFHRRNTATDLAEMVLALEEGELSTMLAFPNSDGTDLYVASDSGGIWSLVESKEHHEIYHALTVLTERLDRMVITGCKALIKRLRSASSGALSVPLGPEALGDAMREAEEHLSDLVRLFEQLRTPAVASGVVKRIVMMRVVETKAAGFSLSMLDTATFCVAFADGVYDFRQGRMLRGNAARDLHQTLTTMYDFDEIDDPDNAQDSREGYERFMHQIYSSSPEARTYVIDLLASSLLNENRQAIVFHFNVKGANGKSKVFELFQCALGKLFIKCASTVLNRSSMTSPSAPNEELVSMKGRRAVVVSEPSCQLKFSGSTIKELTGGDEQSTRGNYQKKQTFVFNGMLHVLCNKIPEFDDMDGGMARRIRAIPYGSTFVDDPRLVNESEHVYPLQSTISRHFPKWRVHLMREIMAAATARAARLIANESGNAPSSSLDNPPPAVLAATRDLIDRESTIQPFVDHVLVRTNEFRHVVTLRQLHDAYTSFCFREHVSPDKKKYFKPLIVAAIGPISLKSNSTSNFWRGWQIKDILPEVIDDEG